VEENRRRGIAEPEFELSTPASSTMAATST
jgi:hypothetical protein